MTLIEAILTVALAIGMAGFLYLMDFAPKSSGKTLKGIDPAFQMPDMRLHYSPDTLYQTLDAATADGRAAMRRYWRLDFGFIACFWVVMNGVALNIAGRGTLFFTLMLIAATLRAALDLLENTLLLRISARYPTRRDALARFAGFVTSAKFVMLGAWVALLFVRLVMRAWNLSV